MISYCYELSLRAVTVRPFDLSALTYADRQHTTNTLTCCTDSKARQPNDITKARLPNDITNARLSNDITQARLPNDVTHLKARLPDDMTQARLPDDITQLNMCIRYYTNKLEQHTNQTSNKHAFSMRNCVLFIQTIYSPCFKSRTRHLPRHLPAIRLHRDVYQLCNKTVKCLRWHFAFDGVKRHWADEPDVSFQQSKTPQREAELSS